jgi:transcriptional regulator with XRE-family HTH domain
MVILMEIRTFGEHLRNIRLSNGYKNQKQLASKTGISAATISRIESNIQRPEPETLKIISDHLLDTSYESLLELAGYLNKSSDQIPTLTDKDEYLLTKAKKLTDTQYNLILKLMDEMIKN